MIRALALLLLLPVGASAQAYVATEAGKACPPNSTPVMLQDGRWVCAVVATLTPLENPVHRNAEDTK